MRSFRILPFFSLLLGVHASFLESREPAPHRLDVRDTPDACALISYSYGWSEFSNQCICLSTALDFVQNNPTVAQMIAHGDTAETIYTFLETWIGIYSAESKCVRPEYSTPTCANGNPCDFTCTDGFTASPAINPTTCVCNAPSIICNGQCVAAGSCPSQALTVSKKKRRWVGSGSCTDIGPGWLACGVLGAGPRAWECVNAARDLESCGGCMSPLTAYSPIGKDCSALPGVADVSCMGGECIVHRCMPGYMLAFDGTSCIRKHHISHSQFADPEDVPARVYGLEHVPLGRN